MSKTIIFRDNLVTVTREYRPSLDPHSQPNLIFEIDGHKFDWLQGSSPYYYKIGNGRHVVFSLLRVGNINDERTVVIYDMANRRTNKVDISKFRWGSYGASSQPDQRDFVKRLNENTIQLRAVRFNYEESIEIDLTDFKITKWQKSRDGKVYSTSSK
jgi:hypothetical protein